jgi:Flp pilus assembly pilin Flp
MFYTHETWGRFSHDQRAVTALEYGLVASVIVGTILVGFGMLSSDLSSLLQGIGDCVMTPDACVDHVRNGGSLIGY